LLLDLMMPVMSGAELLTVLSETGRLAKVAVIVLSATGRPSDVPAAQKFVRKPVATDVLLLMVREVCDSGRSA
jgi:CheY-like chemotaxis protein